LRMNVKIENVDKNVVQLEIEVDAAKFEEGMRMAFKKNAKKFNVPGFRKGKAPRNIVERLYGEEIFHEDAFNFICPEVYDKAVKENGIKPVSDPEIDIKQIGKNKPLIFTAKVAVKPDVELGEYKGIEVNKIDINISEEDVENEIKKVREKNGRIVSVEDRGLQNGDIAIIDYEGFIDGKPFNGGQASGYSLEIGSGKFIPGFEERLIGIKPGDETEFDITFPDDYAKSELAGKLAHFKVKLNEIKVKELPALDDEFAKDVSEYDTLDEYKESVRQKLLETAEANAKREIEDNVINKVVENASVDIPQVMIESRIDSLVRSFENGISRNGIDMELYLGIMKTDMNAFREKFRETAEKDVKTQLVLEKVSQVEEIEISEEELDEEIGKAAKIYGKDKEDFKKHLKEDDIEYIKRSLVAEKTVDFLVKNSKQA